MIIDLIANTLASLGVPVSWQKYSGTATTYITFLVYNKQGEAWAENVEIATGYYLQVDIWSKGDYSSIEAQVEVAMIAAGFIRTTAQDLYESDTQIYHKAMRFSYVI